MSQPSDQPITASKPVALYGGAMSFSLASYTSNADGNKKEEFFVDASLVRDVPDNQEMFFQPKIVADSNSNHNQRQNISQGVGGACLIIELLSRQDQFSEAASSETEANNETLNFFFRDYATAAGANIVSLPGRGDPTGGCPPNSRSLGLHLGTPVNASSVMRGVGLLRHANNDGTTTDVVVYTGILRIPPPFATEIFITLSVPQPAPSSSDDGRSGEGHSELYCPTDVDAYMSAPGTQKSRALVMFETALASTQVKNFGLFVCE